MLEALPPVDSWVKDLFMKKVEAAYSDLLCASTSATWESQEPLTIKKLKEALASLPKISDPLEEYMIQHSYPPKLGGRMWWPARLVREWGPFGPPYYVRVTGTVQYPEMFFTEPQTEEPEMETIG